MSRKPDTTHVTEADHAAEQLHPRRLAAAARPGDAMLGEEFGTEGTGDRRWIIDPIDGTKNYVRGVPIWATLIALEEDGELRVGVVLRAGARTHAGRRRAARARSRTSAPIAVSKVARARRRAALLLATSRGGTSSGPARSR